MNKIIICLSLFFLSKAFYAGESLNKKMKSPRFHAMHKPISVGERLRAIQLELEKGPEYADIEYISQLSDGISESHMSDQLRADILEVERIHRDMRKHKRTFHASKEEKKELEEEATLKQFNTELEKVTQDDFLQDKNKRQQVIKNLNQLLKKASNKDDYYSAIMKHFDEFIEKRGAIVLINLNDLFNIYSKLDFKQNEQQFQADQEKIILPFVKMYVMFFGLGEAGSVSSLALKRNNLLFDIKRANSVCEKSTVLELIEFFGTNKKGISYEEKNKNGIKTNLNIEEYVSPKNFIKNVNKAINSLGISIECEGKDQFIPKALDCLVKAYHQVLQQGTK